MGGDHHAARPHRAPATPGRRSRARTGRSSRPISLIWGASFLFIAIGLESFEPGRHHAAPRESRRGHAWPSCPGPDAPPARGPLPHGRAVGHLGRHPVHAVPARRAAHQLRGRRPPQRRRPDVHGRCSGCCSSTAAPTARSCSGSASASSASCSSASQPQRGLVAGARRRPRAARDALLRPRHEPRRPAAGPLRLPARDGPHAGAGHALDAPVRDGQHPGVDRGAGARWRPCSCSASSAPGWRTC